MNEFLEDISQRPLTKVELRALMRHFEKLGCRVRYLQESCFDFEGDGYFPAHVYATPYFLQFSTAISAVPVNRRGRLPATRDRFVNAANQEANLVKVMCDSKELDPLFGWRMTLEAKLITGQMCRRYEAKAIERFVALFQHDIAQLVTFRHSFDSGVFRSHKENA